MLRKSSEMALTRPSPIGTFDLSNSAKSGVSEGGSGFGGLGLRDMVGPELRGLGAVVIVSSEEELSLFTQAALSRLAEGIGFRKAL